ncbi:MAG: hypothetical protein J6B95_00495 [Oscillospiraceae bacterium]|nr:hypothetical protein [Oscillospiraceae bacterium]
MLLLLIQALSFCVSSAESGPAVLELELPVYGSVYMCDDYNFMVVGQNNTEEGKTKEVFRIIRYSKDRECPINASLHGTNTISLRALDGDRIVWNVTNDSAPVLYEVSTSTTHIHSYTVTDPTCTAEGTTVYTCGYISGNMLRAFHAGPAPLKL